MPRIGRSIARLLTLTFLAVSLPVVAPVQASEIKAVVNGVPVTSYAIARRQAFLRLQKKPASAKAAEDILIEEAIQSAEMKRRGVQVPQSRIDEYFNGFAKSNKMSPAQLTQVLNQSGVTAEHYKEYISHQMGWGALLRTQARSEQQKSRGDITSMLTQRGGAKPTSTEYILQQVIFVVPESERGSRLSARTKEANAMRQRFQNCENTRDFAKGLLDVTVRDLGRTLEPELPAAWKEHVTGLQQGQTTPVITTERGAEFLAVCRTRSVSDDVAAATVLSLEGEDDESVEEVSEAFMQELREKADIQRR